MLLQTHTMKAPWTLVKANSNLARRINIIRDLLSHLHFKGLEREANLGKSLWIALSGPG